MRSRRGSDADVRRSRTRPLRRPTRRRRPATRPAPNRSPPVRASARPRRTGSRTRASASCAVRRQTGALTCRGAVRTSAARATARTLALGSSVARATSTCGVGLDRDRGGAGVCVHEPRRYRRADRARPRSASVSGRFPTADGPVADPVLTDRSDVGPGGTDPGRSSDQCSPGSVSRTGRHRPCRYGRAIWPVSAFELSRPGWRRASSAPIATVPAEKCGAERGNRHQAEDSPERVRPGAAPVPVAAGPTGAAPSMWGSAWQSVGQWTRRNSSISRVFFHCFGRRAAPRAEAMDTEATATADGADPNFDAGGRWRTRPAPDLVARGRRARPGHACCSRLRSRAS